jgi:hypothetical protein
MSIAQSPLGSIPKYAKTITPPDVRVGLPWYSLFLGALLKPLDIWVAAYWPSLYALVQSQKGRNPNRLFIQYELNRVFNTTGFQVLFNNVYISDSYIGFFTEGGADEYDGFFTEEPSTNLNFEGFQYEYKTNPLGFVIAPDGFDYPLSDPFNAIAAVVDGLRIPCQLYQITVNGTTQNRPI